jgi:photosystem II stability/assembly factor-like uncharacterized protein
MKSLVWCCEAALLLVIASGGLLRAQENRSGPWVMQVSGTTAGLRGIHAVGGGVAWASGVDGTVLRTEDSGYMWQRCAMPPGAKKLDYRGIWGWDENTAVVMSSGPGILSRIYKTTDGCSHWKLLFTNPDKDGFWDAMVFFDRNRGILLGDPTLNRTWSDPNAKELDFTVLKSFDGGVNWQRDSYDNGEVKATDGSSAFAASNSSLAAFAHNAWFGTGGKAGTFIFVGDYFNVVPPGNICDCSPMPPRTTWFTHRVRVPLATGTDSSGVFSLAFRDGSHGIAVGGDYTKSNESAGTAAWSQDGGQHWTAANRPPHGYRSAVAWDSDAKAWIAAGTNGSDISYDDGKTWVPLDDGNWNALSLPWVVGPNGRIAKLDPGKLPQK